MLIFFGDPETKGDGEDAKACLHMAIEMQDRIAGLDAKWRNAGIEHPFRVRMGINTGFCNVGNFGSDDRMDYTIIGARPIWPRACNRWRSPATLSSVTKLTRWSATSSSRWRCPRSQ